ncbi:hypothetical protein AAZX31_13G164000 [Glycine max]
MFHLTLIVYGVMTLTCPAIHRDEMIYKYMIFFLGVILFTLFLSLDAYDSMSMLDFIIVNGSILLLTDKK